MGVETLSHSIAQEEMLVAESDRTQQVDFHIKTRVGTFSVAADIPGK